MWTFLKFVEIRRLKPDYLKSKTLTHSEIAFVSERLFERLSDVQFGESRGLTLERVGYDKSTFGHDIRAAILGNNFRYMFRSTMEIMNETL